MRIESYLSKWKWISHTQSVSINFHSFECEWFPEKNEIVSQSTFKITLERLLSITLRNLCHLEWITTSGKNGWVCRWISSTGILEKETDDFIHLHPVWIWNLKLVDRMASNLNFSSQISFHILAFYLLFNSL